MKPNKKWRIYIKKANRLLMGTRDRCERKFSKLKQLALYDKAMKYEKTLETGERSYLDKRESLGRGSVF
jgi:hypothetical protein